MESSEKIVSTYLRLNGFFLMSNFTVLHKPNLREIDFLAVRVGGIERVGPPGESVELCLDERLLTWLGKTRPDCLAAVVEVEGERGAIVEFNDEKCEYAKNLFGTLPFVRLGFERSRNDFELRGNVLVVSITQCLDFIEQRFRQLEEFAARGIGGLSKAGSWKWSEPILSDLLFLRTEHFFGHRQS